MVLDLAYTAIEFAIRELKAGDPETALRGLEHCRLEIAKATLKQTDADPESPFVAEVIGVIVEESTKRRVKS